MMKIPFFSSLSVAVIFLCLACLNPIGFGPDSLPAFKVKGEISIDSTNSAELQIRNHTYSIDIFQVDIERVTSENPVFTLDTRISGAPIAGTQESILLRPIASNPISKDFVTITGYKVKIGWRTSKTIPAELKTKLEANNKLYTIDKEIEFKLTELPRGKLVLHVYRDSNGDIQIELEKDFKPDAADFHYDDDFSLIVKNTNGFTYNGGQITIVNDNNHPIVIDFSPDVRAFLENIALSLTSNKPYPNGYNILLIQNHTEVDVKDLFFTNDASYDGSNVATGFSVPLIQSEYGDNQGYAILKYGNWKASSKSIPVKSISIPKQGYLHIYETSSGSLAMTASEHEWNTIRQNIVDISPKYEYNDRKYGRIKIRNYSDTAVDTITFINRSAASINYRIADVGKATGPNPGTVLSDSVVAGNYRVFIQLSNGRHIIGPEGLDIAVKAEKFTNENDNFVDIIQTMITPVIPNITYSVQSNGGPPLDNKMDGYTTTELTLIFSNNVPSFTITKTSGSSILGTPTLPADAVQGNVWKVPVTSPHAETLRLTITGTNIDPAEHSVLIYVQAAAPPSFVPVTDVVVLNGADFTKGVPKTLQWKIIPENAITQIGYWTLGEVDGNITVAQILGNTPPYHLGTEKYGTSDPNGMVTVETNWKYDYLNIAYVIPNGKAPGKRNAASHTLGATVMDKDGNSVTISIQALNYDEDKDFVKLFRLENSNAGIAPTPPSSSCNVVLNYIGRGAGNNAGYPGGEWSVNLIEVVKRPPYLRKADGLTGAMVTDKGRTGWLNGDPATGKSSVWWQPNPMDERAGDFGGTSEGWISGNFANVAHGLELYNYPPDGAPLNSQIPSTDRRTMAFAYQQGGYYGGYHNNFSGEVADYFLGSINLGAGTTKGAVSGTWIRQVSGDGKLNAASEQYGLNLPAAQGPLWIRLRMDYSDGTVGYWWKAVDRQEWFVFDPAYTGSYGKDINGKIVIDVDLYATPYMSYRK